ncbi:hypothetical protein ED92_22805 [Amycolatopsis sp. MJM2582]|nr:hypothetical protein ED92_22805 [Amycolatopsis sp. MJM2582]
MEPLCANREYDDVRGRQRRNSRTADWASLDSASDDARYQLMRAEHCAAGNLNEKIFWRFGVVDSHASLVGAT